MKNIISSTGKKKLERQINKWMKNIKAFMWDYGFCKGDDYYQEVVNIVWNYVNDYNIISWSSDDPDTNAFIEEQINKLSDAIEKSLI